MLQIADMEKLLDNRNQALHLLNTELATERAAHQSKTQLLAKVQDEIHALKASDDLQM